MALWWVKEKETVDKRQILPVVSDSFIKLPTWLHLAGWGFSVGTPMMQFVGLGTGCEELCSSHPSSLCLSHRSSLVTPLLVQSGHSSTGPLGHFSTAPLVVPLLVLPVVLPSVPELILLLTPIIPAARLTSRPTALSPGHPAGHPRCSPLHSHYFGTLRPLPSSVGVSRNTGWTESSKLTAQPPGNTTTQSLHNMWDVFCLPNKLDVSAGLSPTVCTATFQKHVYFHRNGRYIGNRAIFILGHKLGLSPLSIN